MSLICDDCGDTITGITHVLPDAEVVWTLVFEHGWTGSPFAAGPHLCPRCSMQPEDGDAGGARKPGLDGVDGVDDDRAAGHPGPAEAVRRALAEAVTRDRQVLVDLADVRTIDSTGLGLLVRAHQEARQDGKVLCLVAPSRFVRTVLHTMRLDSVFPVIPSRTVAFRRSAGPPVKPARPAHTTGMVRQGRPPGEHPPVQHSPAAPAAPATTTEVAR